MSETKSILVGDVGGTNTRLGIAYIDGDDIRLDNFSKFRNDDYVAFEAVLDEYLRTQAVNPYAASFAIAGSIQDGAVSLTNRDWHISSWGLSKQYGFKFAQLHNDFAAMARSVPLMDSASFEVIYESGKTNDGAPIVVAGPGTGFGVAVVVPLPSGVHILPSEGGHQAFTAYTEDESELLHILQKDTPFVSLELVSSGSGMDRVHKAICKRHSQPYAQLAPHIIRERADAGDTVCLEVCEVRAAAVMGAAADMALASGALGGVVLAGGVSVRLYDYIKRPKAMERYFNRGARTDYIKQISVRLLTNPEAPLFGAAALYRDTQCQI